MKIVVIGTLLLAMSVSAASPQPTHRRPPTIEAPPTAAPSYDARHLTVSDREGLALFRGARFPRPLACEISDIGCDDVALASLAIGDCTLSDGTYADFYGLDGAQNQLVAATVRPLSALYADPTVFIAPPPGNASKTPITIGGAAGTVWYKLTSSGEWGIAVGSANLFAVGKYALDTYCETDDSPGQCIYQDILCGQSQGWYLTSQSCRFSGGSDRLYQIHSIYGVVGDVLRIEMASDDFRPLFGIYVDNSLLKSSVAVGNDTARLTYSVPTTGFYDVIVTSTEDRDVGFYVLSMDCAKSGCLYPLIMSQPTEVEVPYGQSATLTLDVHHIGPVEYRWYEFTDFPTRLATTSTPQWQTGPITADHSYYVTASSPCGSPDSDTIRVSVKTNRRRAARH